MTYTRDPDHPTSARPNAPVAQRSTSAGICGTGARSSYTSPSYRARKRERRQNRTRSGTARRELPSSITPSTRNVGKRQGSTANAKVARCVLFLPGFGGLAHPGGVLAAFVGPMVPVSHLERERSFTGWKARQWFPRLVEGTALATLPTRTFVRGAYDR